MTMEVTPLHIERGREMLAVIRADGISADHALERLAAYLGISPEAATLAVALGNEGERIEAATHAIATVTT